MRAGYSQGIGLVMAAIFAPIIIAGSSILPVIGAYFGFIALCVLGILAIVFLMAIFRAVAQHERKKLKQKRAGAPGEPVTTIQNAVSCEAMLISSRPVQQPHNAASKMGDRYDKRFALIDRDGQRRYAQILGGTFQLGKARDATPSNLCDFASAVLKQGKSGRFTRTDGSKHGILGFGGRSREATAYELDPSIAVRIGVPPKGQL